MADRDSGASVFQPGDQGPIWAQHNKIEPRDSNAHDVQEMPGDAAKVSDRNNPQRERTLGGAVVNRLLLRGSLSP